MRASLVKKTKHAAILFAALAASIPGLSLADAPHTFTVTTPPLALPLLLSRAGVSARARLDLPAVGDTIVLGHGRRLQFLANGLVPAVLETERSTQPVTVRFDEATCTAGIDATAHLVRTLHVRGASGEEIAALEIQSDLDVFGLADERPHVTLQSSTARALGPLGGALAGAELVRDVPIATRAFPLDLTASDTHLALAHRAGTLSGQLVLERRLSPGAVLGESTTRVALQVFDAGGRDCGALVTAVKARAGDPDRWEASPAEGVTRAAIVWTKAGDHWSGAVEIEGAQRWEATCRPARALVTLGDSTSPFVVQASGAVAFGREALAGASTPSTVRLEP